MIFPILSNVLLHEVLDRWFERDVLPRMRGKAYLVRFADDAVLGFEKVNGDVVKCSMFSNGPGQRANSEDHRRKPDRRRVPPKRSLVDEKMNR